MFLFCKCKIKTCVKQNYLAINFVVRRRSEWQSKWRISFLRIGMLFHAQNIQTSLVWTFYQITLSTELVHDGMIQFSKTSLYSWYHAPTRCWDVPHLRRERTQARTIMRRVSVVWGTWAKANTGQLERRVEIADSSGHLQRTVSTGEQFTTKQRVCHHVIGR